MIRLRHKLLIHAFRVFDQLVLVGTLIALVVFIAERGSLTFVQQILNHPYHSREIAGVFVLLLAWGAIFNACVRYDANRFTTLGTTIIGLLKATILATFLLFVIGTVFSFSRLNNTVIVLFWAITSLIGVISRLILRSVLMVFRRSGYNCRHAVFVGANEHAVDLARRIDARAELGYRIAGFISETDQLPSAIQAAMSWPVLGSVANIKTFLEKGTVDEVMVCLPIKENFSHIYEIIQLCEELGIVVRVIPEVSDIKVLARSQLELFETDYVVTFFRQSLLLQLLLKRAMDLFISATLLVMLSPVLLLIACLIKLSSCGPVFFVQERIGMNRRKFNLIKFRSMVADAEQRKALLADLNEMDGPVFKIRNDPRVTTIGRFLRKTSMDELPQLINVFKGEMSLVGPRPPLLNEVNRYEWLHHRRLSIKPGITCLWQISGRNNVPFTKWMELDRQYIENWSIWLDLKILCKTIPVVFLGKGAS